MMNLKKLLKSFLLFNTISCTSIPDIESCVDNAYKEGFCVKMVSKESRIIPFQKWYKQRNESIKIAPAEWSKLKEFFFFHCKKNNECSTKYESNVKESLDKLDAKK